MRRKKIIRLAVFFVLLAGGILFYIFSFFYVKKVNVYGRIIPLLGVNLLSKDNLLLLKEPDIENALKKKNPSVKKITISKNFPDKLNITVIERIPVMVITDGTRMLAIDEEGMVLENNSSAAKTPVIKTALITFGLGNPADWKIIKAKDIILELERKGIFTDQIAIDDNSGNYILKTKNQIEIIIPLKMSINTLSASLQLIISRFRIEGKIINKIDFQFEKPIVVLKNGEKMSSTL